jgi:hypothetical protein
MTSQQEEFLTRVLVNNKAFGYPNKVHANYMEPDRRRVKKVMRELVTAGYVSQTGEEYTATDKLWQEVVTEPVDLIAIWEKDRTDGWNKRKQLPFVRFLDLTTGQKKTVMECAGHYQWFVCHSVPLSYETPIQDGDLSDAIVDPDTNLGEKVAAASRAMKAKLAEQKRGGHFPDTEIVLKLPGLTAHVEKTLAAEKFAALYAQNLKWGLTVLNVATNEDAKEIVTSDEPEWLFGTNNSNLGADPAKWGEKLKGRIQNAREGIVRLQNRLAIMESIDAGVEALGGWDVFNEQYRAKLVEELAKK